LRMRILSRTTTSVNKFLVQFLRSVSRMSPKKLYRKENNTPRTTVMMTRLTQHNEYSIISLPFISDPRPPSWHN